MRKPEALLCVERKVVQIGRNHELLLKDPWFPYSVTIVEIRSFFSVCFLQVKHKFAAFCSRTQQFIEQWVVCTIDAWLDSGGNTSLDLKLINKHFSSSCQNMHAIVNCCRDQVETKPRMRGQIHAHIASPEIFRSVLEFCQTPH